MAIIQNLREKIFYESKPTEKFVIEISIFIL